MGMTAIICSYCYHLLSVCVIKEKIILTVTREGARKFTMRTRQRVLDDTPAESSFMSLIQRTIPGDTVTTIVDAAIAVNCLGCGIGMLIVMGDLIPGIYKFLSHNTTGALTHRFFWVTVIGWVISFPLSFSSTMASSIPITEISMLLVIGVTVVATMFYNYDVSSSAFDIRNPMWRPCP